MKLFLLTLRKHHLDTEAWLWMKFFGIAIAIHRPWGKRLDRMQKRLMEELEDEMDRKN